MSMDINIAGATEITKTYVVNSSLDDDIKTNLLTILQKSAIATNGIKQEEKIQSLTENMNGLIRTISIMMVKNDQRLNDLEKTYYEEHPKGDIERLQHNEKMLRDVEDFRDTYGLNRVVKVNNANVQKPNEDPNNQTSTKTSSPFNGILDKIFSLLDKWYVWITIAIGLCSPHANEIIKTIIASFQGGN